MESGKKDVLVADATLDVRGESCPYPEMYTIDALQKMKAGQVLEVIADCPQSFINVPASVNNHGYTMVHEIQEGHVRYFYIQVK